MNNLKKTKNKLSDREKEIVLMLKAIEDDETFVIASVLIAHENNFIDKLYELLKEYADIDSGDVLDFLLSDEDD